MAAPPDKSPFTGAFSFCSIPPAGLARRPSLLLWPAPLGRESLRPVSGTRTPGVGASHRRINESLFALALVEPTQYVTQLASGHYFLCPSHHNCHLRSLAELSSSSAPLWRIAAGAVSGSQHTGSGSPGGTSRSALGATNAVGGVDEFEQP